MGLSRRVGEQPACPGRDGRRPVLGVADSQQMFVRLFQVRGLAGRAGELGRRQLAQPVGMLLVQPGPVGSGQHGVGGLADQPVPEADRRAAAEAAAGHRGDEIPPDQCVQGPVQAGVR